VRAGFWAGADIAARRAAGTIGEKEFVEQTAQRAHEKQKMLNLLFDIVSIQKVQQLLAAQQYRTCCPRGWRRCVRKILQNL
jgi:hypothetical protein